MVDKKIDIHNYKRSLEREHILLENSKLSDKNKNILRRYAKDLQSKGISFPRVIKYLSSLRRIGERLGKDFDRLTRKDLEEFLLKVHEREDYSIWTKYDFNVVIKRFYRWFLPAKDGAEFPLLVRWIRTTVKKKDTPRIKKSELITEEEIKQLLTACENSRDRALISVAWETGARVAEFGGMRIENISFDKDCTTVDLAPGKTGSRTTFLIESTPKLAVWVKEHPFNEKKTAPLWINKGRWNQYKNEPLCYRAIYKTFERIFKKANVKKNFNPHLFRHSRATWCAEQGWSPYQMCKFFGWTLDSKMPATYISLVDKDVKDAVFKSYGLETEQEKKVEQRKPKTCPRCGATNESNAKYCLQCGIILDLKLAMKMKEVDQLTDDMNEGYLTKKDPNLNMKEYVDGYVEELVKKRLKELTTK